ncbi:heavy metal-binding domain-containing protein [Cytophaga aurantiaca]|uniref:heavy metal-binding domain-containing protein n=1 Tax=Cytophaga aurantiaca TaxID=29530 RepID=UPI00037B2AEF|nr:heavy metal-binding domain-containing protein [Cytophaga aurantiaca]
MKHHTESPKYTCSMHPQILQDTPGNCPICGMTLVLFKHVDNANENSHRSDRHNLSMRHVGDNHDFAKIKSNMA